jgi:hypothetical protein
MCHADKLTCSIYYLTKGTLVPEVQAKFVDFSSINSLCRSAVEAFLLFNYIYVNPNTIEEGQFRYLAWRLSSAYERKAALSISERGREILDDHESYIDKLKEKIVAADGFKSMSDKQKRRLLTDGMKFFPPVYELARLAGYSEAYAKYFYKYLCGHVHGGHNQIRQIHQAVGNSEQTGLTEGATTVVMITMAFFVKEYINVIGIDERVLTEKSELHRTVNLYYEVGRTPMENFDKSS